jgi:hypothetical protein
MSMIPMAWIQLQSSKHGGYGSSEESRRRRKKSFGGKKNGKKWSEDEHCRKNRD